MTTKTPAMYLQELSTKRCGHGPNYQLITQEQGTHENVFEYIVHVLDVTAIGKGRSKKVAKQEAAKNALRLLQMDNQSELDPIIIPTIGPATSAPQASPDSDGELQKVVNYIGDLDETVLINGLPSPEYKLICDSGPQHLKIFTYEGRLGASIVAKSTAGTKKLARQNVAKQILERLEGIVSPLVKDETGQLQLVGDPDTVLSYAQMPNYRRKFGDSNLHLKEHLQSLDISFQEIEQFFSPPHSEDKMRQMLDKINLQLDFGVLSDVPVICVHFKVNTFVSLSSLGVGPTLEVAKEMAINRLFQSILAILK